MQRAIIKRIVLCFCVLALVVLCGCDSRSSPSNTTQGFILALSSGNSDKAITYICPREDGGVAIIAAIKSNLNDSREGIWFITLLLIVGTLILRLTGLSAQIS